MKSMLRLAAVAILVLFTGSASADVDTAKLPAALRDWVAWVERGNETIACPLLVGEGSGESENDAVVGTRACAWPGPMELKVDKSGASFSVRWKVYAKSALVLPGNAEHWPQDVTVDGKPVPVVKDTSGQPVLWLEPGDAAVGGRFTWETRPEALVVPPANAWIRLTVDGATVAPIERTDEGVWLGRSEEQVKGEDSLAVLVFRKYSDGVPGMLETRMTLDVAGDGREEALGVPLPSGFQPVAMSGDLPARLDPSGKLSVQVRPGHWTINLRARATTALAQLSRGEAKEPWPDEEVWSYEAASKLRVTQAVGEHPLDPKQAGVPAVWQALPAFALEPTDKITIEERSRGLSPQDQNRLSLARELWLDFDGSGWSTRDRVNGQLLRDFRLDVAAPFELLRANENGDPLLITHGKDPALTGVELRQRQLDLSASNRINSGSMKLPINGWKQNFDAVSATVHLPPGYRLYAAIGADQAPGAWIDRWNLLDMFLLALITVMAGWLAGRGAATVTLGYLLIAYHEYDAPRLMLLWLLGLALVLKLLPLRGTFGAIARYFSLAIFGLCALGTLSFVVTQARLALYPQLESTISNSHGGGVNLNPDGLGQVLVYPNQAANEEYAPSANQRSMEPPAEMPMNAPVTMAAPPAPAAPPMPPAKAAPQTRAMEQQGLSDMTVTGSRMKRVQSETAQPVFQVGKSNAEASRRKLQRYATSNVVQAGRGEPTWEWSRYSLSWSGPVLPDQDVRLVVSPPWLTRLLRVVGIALLAVLFFRLAQAYWNKPVLPAAPKAAKPSAGGDGDGDGDDRRGEFKLNATTAVLLSIGLAFAASTAVHAETTPADELLQQLRQRVLELPKCAPNCGQFASATVSARGDDVKVLLEAHVAAANTALPIPGEEKLLALTAINVDGKSEVPIWRQDEHHRYIALDRGVHRIELTYRAAAADSIGLNFPSAPAAIRFDGAGWDASGIREGRLETDTLQLSHRREAGKGNEPSSVAQQFPAFVRVTRRLTLDLDWSLETTVERIAPDDAAFSVDLPLVAGENVQTPGLTVKDGRITLPIQADTYSASWSSKINRETKDDDRTSASTELSLTAADLGQRAEVWFVEVGPMWNVSTQGVPPVYPDGNTWVYEFHPLPGESLKLAIDRPVPTEGASLAIDSVQLTTSVGKRARESTLNLGLRSTRGGQHVLMLPPEAEVLSLVVGGQTLNLRPEKGRLSVPVTPGAQNVVVRFREPIEIGVRATTPAIDVGAPASNVRIELQPGADRWLLFVGGPAVGPAVLYWGELVVMALVAFGLARTRYTPLGVGQWFLLGVGFSVSVWFTPMFVVAWLFLLAWREKNGAALSPLPFNAFQLFLVMASFVMMIAIIGTLSMSLMGHPEMSVVGNNSHAGNLAWFADRSGNALPGAWAISLPTWIYKTALFAWALWFAWALFRWARWGLGCFGSGGFWKAFPKSERKAPPPMPATPAADGGTAPSGDAAASTESKEPDPGVGT